MANKPQLSIVIPTRNRSETLKSAIESCLIQQSQDLEVLVVDNASTPDTYAVVSAFDDPRIRYLRHDEPLAMTENWNTAMAEVRGDWIGFIGDDDGLTPQASQILDALIRSSGVRAIKWNTLLYTWPNFPMREIANILCVPTGFGPAAIISGAECLELMSDNAHLGPRGPSVYHGLVERSLIDEAMKTGPLFDSQTPDLFSGTLLSAILAEHDEIFIHINEPVTAAALSGKSNGVAHLTSDDSNEIREDFRSLNSSSGLEFHPELPDLHILFVYIHDTLFRVRDRLGLADSKLRKTPAEIADGCSLGIFQSEPALTGEVNELRRFVEANNLEMRPEWEERMAHPVGKHHPIFHDEGRIGAGEGYINLSGRDLDLHDVVQASAPTSAIRETSRLYQEQIGELRQDVETRDQRIRQLEEESERLSHRLERAQTRARKQKTRLESIESTRTWRVRRKAARAIKKVKR